MEKEFVPYEQVLELKELGFDEPCFYQYVRDFDNDGELIPITSETNRPILRDNNQVSLCSGGDCFAAPLYQQAFRWFRENYNLFHEIQIDRTTEPKFCFDIFQYEHFGNYEEIRIGEWYLYKTQEEAELECLKGLIEMVKSK